MTMGLEIVTLDGPAGVGKTTIARMAAKELGLAYLDTGAMFRAVAFYLGEDANAWEEAELASRLESLEFGLDARGLLCNGQVLGAAIRTEEVGMLASTLAKRAPVRARLKEQQQALGRATALVVEGRDMGTVVFPEARHKFFLDATPEVRAQRRYKQLQEMGQAADLDKLAEQIRARDEQDRTRAIAPLKPAADAVVIDTSALDIPGVLQAVLDTVKQGA